jgi:hypothetical protein
VYLKLIAIVTDFMSESLKKTLLWDKTKHDWMSLDIRYIDVVENEYLRCHIFYFCVQIYLH